MKYSFIVQHEKVWPVGAMCKIMGVLRSEYCHYRKNHHNKPAYPEHQDMLDFVKQIADKSYYTYGSRRMQRALNALGYPASRCKTRSLMQEANVIVRYRKKYKVTTNSNHKKPVFENVLKRVLAKSPLSRMGF